MLSIVMIALAYIIGIAWGLYLEFGILVIALIFFALIMLMIIIFNNKFINISKYFCYVIMLCGIFLAGYFYTNYKISIYSKKYIEGEIVLSCTTISHITEGDYYYKYYVKNEEGDKFLIYIKKTTNDTEFEIGTRLNLIGKFELPDIARNKGGFNYRMYLNSNNVYGIIKIDKYTICNNKSNNIIYNLQNIIRNNFIKIFPKDYAGILNGMLIGDTSDISDEVSTYFEKSGITHLLAVSGSNVALVIAIAEFIFSRLVGKKYSPFFEIIFIVFFVLISGSSSSVVRAGIMAILNIIASLLIRKPNSINNVFTSAFLILLINPLAFANVGFILSFVGTLRNNINIESNKRKNR